MRPAAVLTVVIEIPTGPATAQLAKVQGELKATASTATATTAQMARSTTATTKAAAASQATMASRLGATGKSMRSFGASWNKYVALPVVAIGAAAIKSSVDFHHAMTQVFTQAGAARGEVGKLDDQVLALAKHSVFGPTELANALYHVESVGFRGAKAMKVLDAAQKAATVGNSDLESTTYALVSALETGIKGTGDMTKAIALMDSIVGHGDMRMEDFTAALSTGVLPAAKTFGLSMQDVGAALDIMTARGTPAQAAATRLRMTFSLLGAPSEKASEELKSIGISADELGQTMQKRGLIPAVQLLADNLGKAGDKAKQAQLLSRAFGGGRSSAAIMTLVQNLGDLKDVYGEVGKSADKAAFNKKLAAAQETTANQLRMAWADVQQSLVKIGDVLVPIIIPAITGFAHGAAEVATAFSKMPKPAQTVVVDAALIAASLGLAAKATGFLFGGLSRVAAMGAGEGLISRFMFGPGGFSGTQTTGIFGTAGKTASRGFAQGFGMNFGTAMAALGLGNIIMDATQGDWKGAGIAAGGALAGALAGSFIPGVGPLLGAGIGSLAAPLVGKLFSGISFETKKPRVLKLGWRLAIEKRSVKEAVDAQKHAADRLASSGKDLDRAHHKRKEAVDAERRASHRLAEVEKKYPANSKPVLKAEADKAQAHRRTIRAIHAENRAEQVHGLARKAYIIKTRQAIVAQKDELMTRKKALAQAAKELHQNPKSVRAADKYMKALHATNRQRQALTKTEAQAEQKLGHKQAKALEKVTDRQAKYKHAVDRTQESIINMANRRIPEFTGKLGRSGSVAQEASGKLQRWQNRLENSRQVAQRWVQQGIGPGGKALKDFGDKTQDVAQHKVPKLETSMRRTQRGVLDGTGKIKSKGSGDIQDFSKGVDKGITIISKALQAALGKLGISSTNWKSTTDKKQPKGAQRGATFGLARGGYTVPGVSSGDRHPLHIDGQHVANVESKERIVVVNREAAAKWDSLNQRWPRFGGARSASTAGYAAGGVVAAGKLAQQMGLIPSENPHFGGVTQGAHVTNSLHYSNQAIDVSGGAGPGSSQWSRYWNAVASRWFGHGLAELFYDLKPKYVKNDTWVPGQIGNHADHIHVGIISNFMGALFKALKHVTLHGPDGDLTTVGQGMLDKYWSSANDLLRKKAGATSGDTGGALKGGRTVTASWYGPTSGQGPHPTGAGGVPMRGNMYAELNMGTALGHLPYGHKLIVGYGNRSAIGEKQDIGAGGGGLGGHVRAIDLWTEMADLFPGFKAAGIANVQVKDAQSGAILGLQGGGGGDSAHGRHHGHGLHGIERRGGPRHLHIYKLLKALKKRPKHKKRLERWLDKLKTLGLPAELQQRIKQLTGAAADEEELAERAGNLSSDAFIATAQGKTEEQWLVLALNDLFRLRNALLKGQGQLRFKSKSVEYALDESEEEKKDLEKALKGDKRAIKKLSKKLDAEKKQKHPSQKRINRLERALAIAGDNAARGTFEKALKDELAKPEKKQDQHKIKNLRHFLKRLDKRETRDTALSEIKGKVIPALKEEQSKLKDKTRNLGDALEDVQGRASSDKPIKKWHIGEPWKPPLGELGGRIFDDSLRVRELGGAGTGADVAGVSSAFFDFLKLVGPGSYLGQYAGAFAKGGIVKVGEQGPELAHLPTGTRIHTAQDTAALMQPRVSVENNITVSDDGVDVETLVNGRPFKQAVNREFDRRRRDADRAHAGGAAPTR